MRSVKNYREILKNELERRCQHNPRYSLRAFARDLNLSPARVSEILKGQSGLSKERALIVAEKMGLNTDESIYFADLVESEHARSQVKKKLAQVRLSKYEVSSHQLIQLETFKVISDWYHFAILELLTLKNTKHQISWISESLNITEYETESAINRLIRLGFINKKTSIKNKIKTVKWIPVEDNASTPSDVPSEAIRKFHTQVMEKGIKALNLQSVNERDFSTLIFKFSKESVNEAKEELKKMRRNFVKKYGESSEAESIYCLSTQFFKLAEIQNT